MADRKAVVKNADMTEDMQQDAIDISTQALEKFNIEKDIAAFIKKEFDKKYNPTWHCIVGRNFGSYVTHETKHFIYFYLGQVAILLFKSGWAHAPKLLWVPIWPQTIVIDSPSQPVSTLALSARGCWTSRFQRDEVWVISESSELSTLWDRARAQCWLWGSYSPRISR